MFPFFNAPMAMRPFSQQYRSYSVSMLPGSERKDVERGGKIIMPPSALDQLTRLNIVYPMMFKLTNGKSQRTTHCGVLEFVADEGRVYLPYWMQRNLLLDEGDLVEVESAVLPVATYSKFQPLSVDFLDISNQKAVLENALRNFACLSMNDVIAIEYNNKIYELLVLETKPGPAVSCIECDMNVEFAAPVGYQEPQKVVRSTEEPVDDPMSGYTPKDSSFKVFSGEGNRLDGKKQRKGGDSKTPQATTSDSRGAGALATHNKQQETPRQRGVPDYDWEIGTIKFIRTSRPKSKENGTEAAFSAFSGEGQSLKKKAAAK